MSFFGFGKDASKDVPDYGQMTPKRKVIYQTLMVTKADPKEVRRVADAFEKAGLNYQADMLRKRSKLSESSKELSAARKQVYNAALTSTDSTAVRAVADAYEQIGATISAAKLRDYATALDAKSQVVPSAPAAPTEPSGEST